MPSAWRLVKTKYLANAFDGEGARLSGGRWNSHGVSVVYVSQSLSLALVEALVHLKDSGILPAYSAVRVEFDEALITTVALTDLPPNWKSHPAPAETRAIGDTWVAGNASALLRVPSVVVPSEFNYVINPNHPDFPLISMDAPMSFPFDPRLATS